MHIPVYVCVERERETVNSAKKKIRSKIDFLKRVAVLTLFFLYISAFECLMAAILYMYNFTKQQAPKDLNFTKGVPYNEHVPQAGVYLECAAGGLFILTSLLTILDIMYYEKKEAVSISPVMDEEKPKNVGKDKTINENKKKGEKLVLEEFTEEKSEKKK